MVVYTLWGTRGFTLIYLLWIWRDRHGGKFLAYVVLHPPSIKLRITCVYVLFVVAICPNFQSGSFKTMVVINGHWSILLAFWRCLQRLTLNFFCYYNVNEFYSMVHPQWNLLLFIGVGQLNDIVAYNMENRKVHVIPTCYSQFLKHGILPKINGRPYYLPYVPLVSKLESLAK